MQVNKSNEQVRKELESELSSYKERLQSLRKLNQQQEAKIKNAAEKENQESKESRCRKCHQLELDNKELSKHLKKLLEKDADSNLQDVYKHKVQILEQKVGLMAKENLDLIDKLSRMEEDLYEARSRQHNRNNSMNLCTPLVLKEAQNREESQLEISQSDLRQGELSKEQTFGDESKYFKKEEGPLGGFDDGELDEEDDDFESVISMKPEKLNLHSLDI